MLSEFHTVELALAFFAFNDSGRFGHGQCRDWHAPVGSRYRAGLPYFSGRFLPRLKTRSAPRIPEERRQAPRLRMQSRIHLRHWNTYKCITSRNCDSGACREEPSGMQVRGFFSLPLQFHSCLSRGLCKKRGKCDGAAILGGEVRRLRRCAQERSPRTGGSPLRSRE